MHREFVHQQSADVNPGWQASWLVSQCWSYAAGYHSASSRSFTPISPGLCLPPLGNQTRQCCSQGCCHPTTSAAGPSAASPRCRPYAACAHVACAHAAECISQLSCPQSWKPHVLDLSATHLQGCERPCDATCQRDGKHHDPVGDV